MDGSRRHGRLGAYFHPARLSHFAHAQRQWRRWRRHQGQPLFADPLSGSRGHEHVFEIIYGAYEKAVGDEFGKTVLGFRADETDYTGVSPWTPKLLETFQAMKGYDSNPTSP